MILSSLIDVAMVKPAVEVADIFRLYFDDYLKHYHCTPEEFAAVDAIIACRTAAAGGFIRQCDQCGKFQISYCSCGNRNCPKCGAFAKAQWLAQQEARLLPVPHFQVVFTLDHLINDLAYVNPKAISHSPALHGDRWGVGEYRRWLSLANGSGGFSLSCG